MGISGLYSELGPGSRISLAKYAADHFEATGQRLRLAVDASIWAFQAQAGKGGTNPALRTLYYRLVRLLQLNITPLLVFDGRARPAFKRNHKTYAHLTPALSKSTKALLKLFGFPYHDAPGEAEAECAVLQQQGVVDAVMSEDVDTLMFGCGITFRNWSGQGSGKQTPTHVTVYEREAVERESGLTQRGMVLVALMSGGDYLPEGVPKCGIKIAAECARAGFGEDLCNLTEDDEEGLQEWRERLQFELETNESGWFRRKNKAIVIPSDFPDRTVLGYYTNPVVSNQEAIEKLRRKINWDGQVDLIRLRETVRHAFEWRGKQGAAKFVRTLSPALLTRKLVNAGEKGALEDIVKGLHGKREHFSTDGLKELRISFVPGEIITVDMAAEEEDEVEEGSDQEEEEEGSSEGMRKPKDYDIFAVERIWVLEMYARINIQEIIAKWEQPKAAKTRVKKTAKAKAMEGLGLEFLSISKPGNQRIIVPAKKPLERSRVVGMGSEISIWNDMRPTMIEKDSTTASEGSCKVLEHEEAPATRSRSTTRKPSRTRVTTDGVPAKKSAKSKAVASNPSKKSTTFQSEDSGQESDLPPASWKTARRSSTTIAVSPPRGRRLSALGIYGEPFDEAPCSPADLPYELPEGLAQSPPRSRSPSPHPAPSHLIYETIVIFSSPAPVVPFSPCVSPPKTPSRRRESYTIPGSSQPSAPSHERVLYAPKAQTPLSTGKSLQTPSSAFKRLQIVDLLDDTPNEPVDQKVNRVLDFSPIFTPLSPNVTIRKNRKGRKIREPQPSLRNNDVADCLAPIPFSLITRDTSPPRKGSTATAADATATATAAVTKVDISETCGEVVGGKTAKRIVLRESLEGRWEFIEDGWSVREGTRIWEDLEVLDLTGDD